jgi:hypothetical protein
MKKRSIILLSVFLFVFTLTGCGGLFMSDEALGMVGLWRSTGWNDSEDEVCYYDFRDNGRVYVTDWTDDIELANNPLVPIYFNYSVKNDIMKMSQFMGLANFEFEMAEDSLNPGDAYNLTVLEYSGDYDDLYEGYRFDIQRVLEYTSRDAAAKAFLEEYSHE